MLTFIVILFILYTTVLIGLYVGREVPDEVNPSRKYLILTTDVLLLIMVGLTLFSLGWRWMALLILVLMMLSRAYFSFRHIGLGGVVLGTAFFLPRSAFVNIVILCLILNYMTGLIGENARKESIRTLEQPIAAVMTLGILYLFI